jgi:hypothetical protein
MMFSETVPSTISKCKGAGTGRVNCNGQKLNSYQNKNREPFQLSVALKNNN